jgi:hypothetical protein
VAGAARASDELRCVHCHDSVGHGPRAGLGGPDRGEAQERGEAKERRGS